MDKRNRTGQIQMIRAIYDTENDVLYVALGEPKAAFGDERPGGLLFRYSYEDEAPCGVTVFGYHENWQARGDALSREIASFLRAAPKEVETALRQVNQT